MNYFWDDSTDWLDQKTEPYAIKEPEKKAPGTAGYCYHLWIPYTGLKECFHYCKYCNIKQDKVK